MLLNPELAIMLENDINRRYAGSYIRYDKEIVYVHSIEKAKINYVKSNEGVIKKFEWEKVDCFRPAPRWVQFNNKFYYVSYLMERQFTRGFSRSSSSIWNPMDGQVPIPSTKVWGILKELYDPVPKRILTNTNEVLAKLQISEGVLLSPQVLLVNGNNGIVNVFFREYGIGTLKRLNPLFLQEIKELIGDYDENDARFIPGIEPAAQRARKKAMGDPVFAPLEVARPARRAGALPIDIQWNQVGELFANQNP
jgi:hypothetical protein